MDRSGKVTTVTDSACASRFNSDRVGELPPDRGVQNGLGNLSKWMHQLKTAYTVYFNRRHQVVGHLFPDDSANLCHDAETLKVLKNQISHK